MFSGGTKTPKHQNTSTMLQETKWVANWGNYPRIKALVASPASIGEASDFVRAQPRLIARGNGKCYGDAALGSCILSTLSLNRLLAFDAANGIVHCEAGMLLADLLQIILPKNWFFHVTPGIKAITVGGAIACDVHGKNHPEKGCFSNWLLSFELMGADGQVLSCSRSQNPDLFWQTCGGMGWTGVILSAQFQLMRLPSAQMQQNTVKADDLEALFRAFEDKRHWPYAAAWVDCLPKGANFGRGVAYFADHAAKGDATAVSVPRRPRNISFFAPSWLLNPLSIRMHNYLMYRRAVAGERLVDLDTYFYPLDRIGNWNRLYGRRGFVQYQFCLPEAFAFDGIRAVLETIQKSQDTPFLTVLKRHGERPKEAVHSFPIKGYSLALDFPRTQTIPALVDKLDALLFKYNGKIYLAKDALSHQLLGRIDPLGYGHEKFESSLKQRISADEGSHLG